MRQNRSKRRQRRAKLRIAPLEISKIGVFFARFDEIERNLQEISEKNYGFIIIIVYNKIQEIYAGRKGYAGYKRIEKENQSD